jgi:signal peptidase I
VTRRQGYRLVVPEDPNEPGASIEGDGDPYAAPAPAADEGAAASVDHDERPRRHRSFWIELPVLIVVALVVAVFIKTFLIQAFFIPSASMRDTLVENDRVMVNKLAYRLGDPAVGQVIVFDSPLAESNDGESILVSVVRNIGEALGLVTPESALIKRVVAVGGQTVEIRDGTLFVDGVAVDEPYLSPGVRMSDYGPTTVPEGHVFVMGDNRGQSEDSRRFGAIPEESIIGRAFIRVWPPSRWGGL